MYSIKKVFNTLSNRTFLVILLLFLTRCSLNASYLNELVPGTIISFKHWDVEKSEVTGFSFFRYEKIVKGGKQFIIEKNKNTKPDGKVFTKKTLWFEANSGIPTRYEEKDFRKDFHITNIYSGQKIKTNLYKAGKILEFDTDIGPENVIPLEIFFFFLRKNFKQILLSKDFSFTLFLPLLAMELEDKGLPRSMSMVQMVVELKEEAVIKTPLGSNRARKILVLPRSSLLRALLPKDKTNFEFLISKKPPYHILQFKVGKTIHMLREFILPK